MVLSVGVGEGFSLESTTDDPRSRPVGLVPGVSVDVGRRRWSSELPGNESGGAFISVVFGNALCSGIGVGDAPGSGHKTPPGGTAFLSNLHPLDLV